MRTVLPDLSGRSSLTGIGHDVRICIWKHSLQRRLPSEIVVYNLPIRRQSKWVGFYLRLYLESRNANSFNNRAMTPTIRLIIPITNDKISYAIIFV